jgi:hypothetical protein
MTRTHTNALKISLAPLIPLVRVLIALLRQDMALPVLAVPFVYLIENLI